MGLDGSRRIDTPTEEKMKELVQLAREIPRDLLFSSEPTSTGEGFRWLPKSFLSRTGFLNPGLIGEAERCLQGSYTEFLICVLISFLPNVH